MNVLSFPHQVTRLVFDAGQPYERFRGRYEAAVPLADPWRLGGAAGRHARWPAIAADQGQLLAGEEALPERQRSGQPRRPIPRLAP
jgi:hypothetical protein